MVFASTGFWAYIYFCQYMLIWYREHSGGDGLLPPPG